MKKFLFALRSIGLTIVGLVIAILVTTGLHSFFGLFLDPLPMVDLQAADWSGRSEIMSRYMAANPFAVLQHAHRAWHGGCAGRVLLHENHHSALMDHTNAQKTVYRFHRLAGPLALGRRTKRSL